MRIAVLVVPLAGIVLAAAGCGSVHHKAAPPAPWARRANALCRADDRKLRGAFDSAAMVAGFRREVDGLTRVGFFARVPAAALEVEAAGRLFLHTRGSDERALRTIDKALLRARRDAGLKGIHCSFAAIPLARV